MKILVTGAKGFIGKNLIAELKNKNYNDIYECDVTTTEEELNSYTRDCEFVFHLAGVNRPKDEEEFMKGNFGFTSTLLEKLKSNNNKAPILITSSIQAELDNPYGKSKKAGEDLMFEYEQETGAKAIVYRLPNVFGKWCRPNYNSAVATFCNNIANDLPITVNDPNIVMNLVYIDDRGSFTEFLRTKGQGQVSVNISKPGITKGNHWHHTKNEKFLVVSGQGLIKFRKYDSDEVIEYKVSGDKLQVVDIPVGYTHSIENVGNADMVTVMWANEPFNPDVPDTYFMEV